MKWNKSNDQIAASEKILKIKLFFSLVDKQLPINILLAI